MQVTICGSALAWRFVGSGSLAARLEGRPWNEAGGTLYVRVDRPETVNMLKLDLETQIESFDGQATRFRFLDVGAPAGGENQPLLRALCRAIGTPDDEGQFALSNRLAESLITETAAVGFVDATGEDCPSISDEADRITDFVAKHAQGTTLTLVVFHCRSGIAANRTHDFSVGAPEDGVSRRLKGERSALWAAYLHTRIAWEVGGAPTMAGSYGRALDQTPSGVDTRLEQDLNKLASQTWDELGSARRAKTIEFVEALSTCTETVDDNADGMDGIPFWRLAGQMHAMPTPWAARAILLAGEATAHCKPLLRYCLVCQPLAQSLLTICFQYEAAERARLESQHPGLTAGNDAARQFREFVQGSVGSSARFYPADHPAKPDCPIAFESFGGFLTQVQEVGGRPAERLYAINKVRNALAHGHYPCWCALMEVRDVANRT